jgi:hypothetical protein
MEEISFDIERIEAIKLLNNDICSLKKMLDEAATPVLHDMTLIPELFEVFKSVFERRGCPEKAQQVYNRKKFLLLMMYLYSPITLVGGRMRTGLRDKLSELFGLNTSTPISDNCVRLLFDYQTYRDFRRDVGIIYREIANYLGCKGVNIEIEPFKYDSDVVSRVLHVEVV